MATFARGTHFWAGCSGVLFGVWWGAWAVRDLHFGGPLLPIAAVLVPHALVPILLGSLFIWKSLRRDPEAG